MPTTRVIFENSEGDGVSTAFFLNMYEAKLEIPGGRGAGGLFVCLFIWLFVCLFGVLYNIHRLQPNN